MPKGYPASAGEESGMNETFDSSAENSSPRDLPGDRMEVASAMSSWKETLKNNLFIVLLSSVAISFLLGYFIAQQQEAKKRQQWAEIVFRQAKDWLTERGRLQAPWSTAWSTPVRQLNKPPVRERNTVAG